MGTHKLTALLVFASSSVWASPGAIKVSGESSCPAPAAITEALKTLLPDAQLSTAGEEQAESASATPFEVSVSDSGDHYEITAGGKTKAFGDPAHRCDERARVSAVFVFLAVAPPAVDLLSAFAEKKPPEPPSEPPPRREAPPAAAKPATPPPLHTDLEMTPLLFEAGWSSGARNVAVNGGIEARFVALFKYVGLSLGVGGMYNSATLDFGAVGAARLSRVPIDLSARPWWRTGSFELGAEIGLRAVVTTIDGANVPTPDHSVHGDVGVRVAALARLWVAPRFGLYLSGFATGSPSPIALTVDPFGQVGSTPGWWAGAALGIVVQTT